MAYSHVRFIAYNTPTIAMKKGGLVEYEVPAEGPLDYKAILKLFGGFPEMKVAAGLVDTQAAADKGKPETLINLKGHSNSLSVVKSDPDIFARMQRLIVTLELAVTTHKYRKDFKKDGVLNLFVAPEFYFRPPEEPRAYTEAVYQAIADVLGQTIRSSQALEHWLVIPGTIMWYRDTYWLSDKKWRVDQNSALVINNDESFMGGQLVEKMRPSRIDAVPSQRLAVDKDIKGLQFDGDWMDRAEFYRRTDMWISIKDHIIDFGGVRIGMEICADHSVLKLYPKQTGDIDAQLLVSCGMSLRPANIVTKPGGFAMRCDGHYGSGIRKDLRQVLYYKSGSEDNGANRWAKSTSAVVNPDNLTISTKLKNISPFIEHSLPFDKGHPLYWKLPDGSDSSYWDSYQQGISFFDPMEA